MRPITLALALLALACAPPPQGAAAAPAVPGAGEASGTAPGPGAVATPAGEASLAIERLDPDPECDAVVPARAPEPVTVHLDAPSGGACVGGVSDGTGAVALGVRDAAGAVAWRVHAASGAPGASFTADAPLLSEPSGWHALQVARAAAGADPSVDHVAISPSGEVVSRARVTPDPAAAVAPRWALAADPAGGSAVAVRSTLVGGNHWSQVTAHRFDASGAERWAGGARVLVLDSPSEPFFLGAGVEPSGDLLVLSQHSASLDVSWLDAAAAAAGGSVLQEPADPVVGPGLSHALELAPLLDGTIAVRADGTWRRRFAPRAPASEPLPDWLAARADRAVRVARGGAGYAVLPRAGTPAPGCATRVDLVSASGRACGRITIREAGSACAVGAVDQGWDGTLVAASAADACTIRWWPGLLAR